MPKNIVICSDGTGNSGGKTRGTNVWRIFNAVDRHNATGREQMTYYDDGVGTDNLRWLKLLGGAFGWGLSRNIRQAYTFLVMNYEEGDDIYLFGFSRGAFTVRSLAGMISRCGLLSRKVLLAADRRQRATLLRRILWAYRRIHEDAGSAIREELKLREVPIRFVGVWDTVDAVGMPLDWMRDLLDAKVWRRWLGIRFWGFYDKELSRKVWYAYQALALDDERKTFHPNVWEPRECEVWVPDRGWRGDRPPGDTKQVMEQVWFAGAHSNVGGGYPKDSLSLVPLDWMMAKAHLCGLRFGDGFRKQYQHDADPHGKLYDSRAGLGAYYRYAPRVLKKENKEERPVIHDSVIERIERATEYYAPGSMLPLFEHVSAASDEVSSQTRPWNLPGGAYSVTRTDWGEDGE